MHDDDEIRDIVGGVIRERLGSSHVADVETMWDDDNGEDDVVDVIVTLESADHEFDAGRLSSLCRYVRAALTKENKTVFPLITFMSREERREDLACG